MTKRKKYKNESLMKLLTILGALLGVLGAVSLFASLVGAAFLPSPIPNILDAVIMGIILLVISIITFFSAYEPDKFLPFNWLVLFVMAILLIVFGSLWGGLCVIIAALIGLIEEL